MKMKITVLGSGTSSGVPLVGCTCMVCRSDNPKNKRLRSSCLFEVNGENILIDTSPDLRQQALIHGITKIDAVLYTHIHADHIHGIDDLRPYYVLQQRPTAIYGSEETIAHLKRHFAYVFTPASSYPSYKPQLEPHVVSGLFDCEGIPVQMVPCHHGSHYMTSNYRIGDIAWITDTNAIPKESVDLLQDLQVLFLDALRPKPHPTHFHLDQSLAMAKTIGAKKTYLIHLSHDYDHGEFNKTLPEGIELAYDGLEVQIR